MGIKVKPLSKNKKKKAKTKSRKPLSRRFKRPKRMYEEMTLEELESLEKEDMEPIREWEQPVDPWYKDDKEKGVYRDSEGDIIGIDVASGGMITKNYAKGGGVRKAKFIDS